VVEYELMWMVVHLTEVPLLVILKDLTEAGQMVID